MNSEHQIEWRLRPGLHIMAPESFSYTTKDDHPWQPMEYERWHNPDHAQDRLKYWEGLSLGRVIEFRIREAEASPG